MRLLTAAFSALPLIANLVSASPYREDLVDYNLNVNKDATDATQYTTTRTNTTYTPSPDNWRALPAYTILMDKFADGDPSNNDYFGTMYESDWRETQLRYGGDLKGLEARLDYIQGMGIGVIFISGTPFLNMVWQADSQCFHPQLDITFLSLFQVILHSISPSLTLIGVPSTIGLVLLTPSTRAACISWSISPSVPWLISSVSTGMYALLICKTRLDFYFAVQLSQHQYSVRSERARRCMEVTRLHTLELY